MNRNLKLVYPFDTCMKSSSYISNVVLFFSRPFSTILLSKSNVHSAPSLILNPILPLNSVLTYGNVF